MEDLVAVVRGVVVRRFLASPTLIILFIKIFLFFLFLKPLSNSKFLLTDSDFINVEALSKKLEESVVAEVGVVGLCSGASRAWWN